MDRRLPIRRNRLVCMAFLIVPDLFRNIRSVDPFVHQVARTAAKQPSLTLSRVRSDLANGYCA
jgi:hypothetical protein